jgi:hypothetical protein
MGTEGSSAGELLQRRAARFGLTVGGVALAGLLLRAAAHLALGNGLASFASFTWLGHAIAGLALLGLWAALREAPRSYATVERLESAAW